MKVAPPQQSSELEGRLLISRWRSVQADTVCNDTQRVLSWAVFIASQSLSLNGRSTGAPHETLFWSNGPNIAVRQGNWKLVKSYDNTWLFDLANDIGESRNLAKSKPEIVEQLENAYQEWRSQMSKPAWPSKPNRRKVEVDGLVYEMNI